MGLSLVTAVTLALEVLFTRVLSVVTWYSLAFFVIAMGLFGLTAGAVHVYLNDEKYAGDRLPSSLSAASLRFALTIPLSFVLLLVLPLRTEPVATTVALFVVFSAALALPFYPAGIVVAAAITRARLPVGRVYAVDLVGAALGAPLVPLVLGASDAGTSILLFSVVAALGSVAFARAAADRASTRRGLIAAALLLVLALVNGASDRGLVPLWVKERPEVYQHIELELWNSHSRVQVSKAAVTPATFWGMGTRCQAPMVTQRSLIIDGHALTPLYHAPDGLEPLRFLECDVTDVANLLRPGGPAAIIGVGGSRDIQAALLAGRRPVLGIELNGHLLDLLKGPIGAPTGVPGHPDVRLVHDDARSYLARNSDKFRLIQASLIDTWAATGAGAHALSENGLYTLEAWMLFLERLTPDGVFTVSRWSTVETARMVALAVGALLESGAKEPQRHLAMMHAGMITTLIVAKTPLTPTDEERLRQIARERGFSILFSPSEPTTAERLRQVVAARSRAELDQVALVDLLDFRPSTDDRPFFFNVLRLRSFFHPLPDVTAGTLEGNLLATRTLGLALLSSFLLVAVAIIGPLWYRARPRGRGRPSLWAGFAYFLLIGVGFMLAEIALLQRLSLVLGHPIYSLIVVLSSLVAAAGFGSWLSDKLPLSRAPGCYVYPIVLTALLAAVSLAWPVVAPWAIAAPTPHRIAFAIAVTGSTGLVLGVAFPAGMRLVGDLHEEETPWLWGLNGVGSVLASSAAICIALESGLTVLMLVSAACYALLLAPIVVLRRERSRNV